MIRSRTDKMDALDIKRIIDELSSFSYTNSEPESSSNPKLSIVLVNWKTRDLLKQCLNSIYKNTKQTTYEIIVVDNDSEDGSIELVRENFPQVTLIVNDTNLMHAKAMNQAAVKCRGEYILFLNPDTIILDGTLDTLVDFMDSHLDVGAITPKILSLNGTLERGCRRLKFTPVTVFFRELGIYRFFQKSRIFGHQYMSCYDENATMEVDIISGISMLIRKETLDKVGLFDENFPLFLEDIDMSYRLVKAGWKIYYVPQGSIIHYRAESTRLRKDILGMQRAENFLLLKKHHSLRMAIFYFVLWLITFPLKFMFYRVFKLH